MKRDLHAVPRYFLIPPISAMAEGTPARVVDMGLRGARLEVRRPFEPGSTIDVIIDTIPVKATVLWCQVDALNFATDVGPSVVCVLAVDVRRQSDDAGVL